MGFLDKAKQLADQAQQKLDDVQKDFNKQSPGQQQEAGAPPVEYDKHGRPIQPSEPEAPVAPPATEEHAPPPQAAPPGEPAHQASPPPPPRPRGGGRPGRAGSAAPGRRAPAGPGGADSRSGPSAGAECVRGR